jgi:hypothetical protein
MFVIITVVISVLISTTTSLNQNLISRESVLKPFFDGKALKVISGLNNFDADLVRNVVGTFTAGEAITGSAGHNATLLVVKR